jgi:hypothetical protein
MVGGVPVVATPTEIDMTTVGQLRPGFTRCVPGKPT